MDLMLLSLSIKVFEFEFSSCPECDDDDVESSLTSVLRAFSNNL